MDDMKSGRLLTVVARIKHTYTLLFYTVNKVNL